MSSLKLQKNVPHLSVCITIKLTVRSSLKYTIAKFLVITLSQPSNSQGHVQVNNNIICSLFLKHAYRHSLIFVLIYIYIHCRCTNSIFEFYAQEQAN